MTGMVSLLLFTKPSRMDGFEKTEDIKHFDPDSVVRCIGDHLQPALCIRWQ